MNAPPTLDLAAFEALDGTARIAAVRSDARGAGPTLLALGDECERVAAGSAARALALGEALHATAIEAGAPAAAARALRATIPALAYLGRLEESLVRAGEAHALATRANDAVEAARAHVASIHALAKLGRTDEALARGGAARDALRSAGRPDLAARAELNIANVHKVRGERDAAIGSLERALSGVPATDAAARGTVLNTLGETLLQADRLDEATQAFDEAETLLAGLPLARAIVAGNKADLLARQGRLGDSIRAFEHAAAIAAPIAPGHHARLRIDEAEALATLGATREALAARAAATQVARDRGLKAELARALVVRARTWTAADARADADAAAEQAIAIAREMSDARTARTAELVRGETALRFGDAGTARACAEAARLDASPLELAKADAVAAAALLLEGDPRTALERAREASARARDLGVRTVEIDCVAVEAACRRALGDVEAAVDLLARAVELSEEMRATLVADRHRGAFTASRLRIYEELTLDLLARKDRDSIAQAFATVERARSRLLLDAMLRAIERTPGAATEGDPVLATLRERLSALHARGASGAEGSNERRGVAPSLLVEMRETEQAIDEHVTRAAAGSAFPAGFASLYARPLGLRAIADRLEATDALIAYFQAGDEVLAFSFFEGDLTCVRAIASAAEIGDLAEKLLFQLRAGVRGAQDAEPSASLKAIARLLHARLIAPMFASHPAIFTRATRLVIVPFGPLHALPFALLHDGERHLIERHEVHMAPSASIACMTPAHRDHRGHALVVGVSDGDAPLIDAEVAALRDELSTHRGSPQAVRTLTGDDATIAAARSAARGARIVHLACHGRFVPSLPAASGLRLSDGWMPLRDIVDLGLDADLVFLSGCETGRHAVDMGDELAGIARAFLAGGARRLVTTLWSVRDAAALDVATRFHSAHGRGSRPSAALRAAMLASIRNRVHPSWWAPFVTTGVLECD